MIPTPRTLVLGLAGATALAVVWVLAPSTRGEVRVPAPPEPPTGLPMAKNKAVGTSGCLAAACHGAPAADALSGKLPEPMWPVSGTCFVARDPHTRAYDALVREKTLRGGPNARTIMAKLGIAVPATEDARCLACHTNPSLAEPGPTDDPHVLSLRREGVSCEACHGNAGSWLRTHTTGDFSAMAALTEVGNRATACLGCHVGAPADADRGYPVRDMNHDMIAAGHPRLNFDFAEYHRRLPRHWREKDTPPSPVREWFVGRVAHAEAACRLLADRAKRAGENDDRTPWPEFAEFDCASCHHRIPQPWRNEPPRVPGSLRWQTIWPATEFDAVKPLLRETDASRPPCPARVTGIASDVAAELGRLRRSPDAELLRLAGGFPKAVRDRPDWDFAGQILWGVAAFERARVIREPSADFARAFDATRRRNWDEFRPAFDRLLSAVPRE